MRFGSPQRFAILAMTLMFGQIFGSPLARAQSAPVQSSLHAASAAKTKLTLRVYNYARLDSTSLAISEKVATAIYERVGIQIAWVDCPLSSKELLAHPECQSRMRPTDLVLRVLPRHMAMKLRHRYEALGFAQTCPETEPACEITVFYHRVDELAAKGYRGDRILGHAIAHEISHVLIGPGHSEEGIMRGEWTHQDLQVISSGLSLDFTRDQSGQIQNAVLRRSSPPIQKGVMQANLFAQ